jgi:hypothetical protein
MTAWWHRHFVIAEGSLLALGSVAIGLWLYQYGGAELVVSFRSNNITVLTALLSLFGTLLGFIIAVVAFLFSLVDKKAFNIFRASRSYADHWSIFNSALNACAAATLASLCGLIAACIDALAPWLVTLILSTTLWSIGRFARVVWVIKKMIQAEVRLGMGMRPEVTGPPN